MLMRLSKVGVIVKLYENRFHKAYKYDASAQRGSQKPGVRMTSVGDVFLTPESCLITPA